MKTGKCPSNPSDIHNHFCVPRSVGILLHLKSVVRDRLDFVVHRVADWVHWLAAAGGG